MDRRNFLRMLSMIPLLKIPNLLNGLLADYGTDSILDDIKGFTHWDTSPHPDAISFGIVPEWNTAAMCPTEIAIDYDSAPLHDQWDYAWTNAEFNSEAGWVNLEIQHLPEKDMLWFCVDGDRICVGEMLPDVTVSWWVEPRTRHTVCCEYVPLFEVPADGQTHFVAITWENGHPVKAYLDSDAVWFSDVKLDEEIVQSQWGYTW